MVATSSAAVVTIQSFSLNQTSYTASTSAGATETITLGSAASVQTWSYQYNAFGHMTQSIDPMGRTFNYLYSANNVDLLEIRETTGGDNFLIGKWEYNSQQRPVTYSAASAETTQYVYNSYGEETSLTDPLSDVWSKTYAGITTATVAGTVASGFAQSITVTDAALPGGNQVVSYTTQTGDTTASIASQLASLINANANLSALRVTAASSGSVLKMSSSSVNTTYSKTVTGAVTITLANSAACYLVAKQGPLAGSLDVTTYTSSGTGGKASDCDSEGYVRRYGYDPLNRLVSTSYLDGTSDQTVYQNLDAIFSIDRLGRTTQDAYDSMDQLSYEIDPLGRKTQYTWCVCGSPSTLTDPAGRQRRGITIYKGRIIQKVAADSTAVRLRICKPLTSRLQSENRCSQSDSHLFIFCG